MSISGYLFVFRMLMSTLDLVYTLEGTSMHTWVIGVTIFLAVFIGYVLPWGQMSLWGATLLSVIPYLGEDMTWLWGGFCIGSPTLTRFFALHFLIPFAILFLAIVHPLVPHQFGSSNPPGVSEQVDKVCFILTSVGFGTHFVLFSYVVLLSPEMFMDPDNFMVANSLVTPARVQPEWYFLFAYTILRSIPPKTGGVVGLVFSVLVLYLAILKRPSTARMSFIEKTALVFIYMFIYIIYLFFSFSLLTWAGSMPAEYPLVSFGKILSGLYFLSVFLWLIFFMEYL